MASKIIYLAEIQPYDPVTDATVTLNFADNLVDSAELDTFRPYHVRMRLSFSSEVGVFDDNVPGGTSFALGTVVLNNTDGAYDHLMNYVWDTRPVTIKKGYEGQPYSAYTTCFKGATLEILNDGESITIVMRDTSYKLIEPLQENKYLGTGNQEGGIDLVNRRKPLCYGRAKNVTPVWVDAALLTMQVHDGPVEAVTAVYDRANKLSFSSDYSDYTALSGATVSAGYYATCLAEGFIRLGAKAAGNITADVNGQFTTTATTLPKLLHEVLLSKVALTASLGPVTNLFNTQNLTSWSPVGSIGVAQNGSYYTLTDTANSNWGAVLKGVAVTTGTHTFGVKIKKDSIPSTTRVAQIVFESGTPTELQLDTMTGSVAITSTTPIDYGVVDLGADWFLYITRNASGSGVNAWIYPVIGSGTTLPVTANSALMNLSIDARDPVLFAGTIADILQGDLDTSSITALSADFPYAYEGIYFQEPEVTIAEFVDNIVNSMNAFWYVDTVGRMVFRQFKFRAPTVTIEEPKVSVMSRESSPAPLYRVVTQYERNATVQTQEDFSIPRETLNGYLKDERVFIPTAADGSGGVYTYTGELEAFLNDFKVNDLQTVQFREITPVPWLNLSADGTFTISDPGGTSPASVVLEARIGEFAVTETFELIKRLSPSTSTLSLSPSHRRFYFSDVGVQTPAGQISIITASGSGLGTLSWTAVDNLGNFLPLTGSGNSRTLSADNISLSPLVQWVRVQALDATNGISNSTKIIVQRGEDAYAAAILEAWAATTDTVDIYYQNTPPTSPEIDDLWFDLDDANKLYRWTGSSWVSVADTRIADALTAAAGAQATADGRIRTFFGTSIPTATAVGDLWFNPTSKILYRWDGTNWSSEVGTWGADWDSSLSGIPTNLAVLVGTEAIQNSFVINSIANDDVLSAAEKVNSLSKVVADLENRYTDLLTRAAAVSVSTTAMTTARTNWLALLDIYNPKWNDTTQDTSIYTHAFADRSFPTNWTLGSGLTTGTNGVYTTLTDDSATQHENISRSKSHTGIGATYSTGIIIKKDTVSSATRWPGFKMFSQDAGLTSVKFGDIILDTQTGAWTFGGSGLGGLSDVGVLDLGREWLLYMSIQTHLATAQDVGVQIFPAYGSGAGPSGSANVATTGSIDVRSPLFIAGGWGGLGRAMLNARLGDFSKQMVAVATAISAFDSSTTDWVDGPAAANVNYDNAGTTIQGQVDLDYSLKTGTGTVQTSGVTGVYQVIEGNVNGFDSTSAAQTLTPASGVFTLSVTAMTTSTAKLHIKLTRNGLTKSLLVTLTKVLSAAVPPGSGGGGGGSDIPSQTSNFTRINTATFTTITQSLTFTLPTGKTTLRCVVNLSCRMLPKLANQQGPWNVEFKVLRGGVDQGSTQNSVPDPYIDSTEEGYVVSSPGNMYYSLDMGSLSAGSQYTVTVQARISSGTLPSGPVGVGMDFFGSVTLSAP